MYRSWRSCFGERSGDSTSAEGVRWWKNRALIKYTIFKIASRLIGRVFIALFGAENSDLLKEKKTKEERKKEKEREKKEREKGERRQ